MPKSTLFTHEISPTPLQVSTISDEQGRYDLFYEVGSLNAPVSIGRVNGWKRGLEVAAACNVHDTLVTALKQALLVITEESERRGREDDIYTQHAKCEPAIKAIGDALKLAGAL